MFLNQSFQTGNTAVFRAAMPCITWNILPPLLRFYSKDGVSYDKKRRHSRGHNLDAAVRTLHHKSGTSFGYTVKQKPAIVLLVNEQTNPLLTKINLNYI